MTATAMGVSRGALWTAHRAWRGGGRRFEDDPLARAAFSRRRHRRWVGCEPRALADHRQPALGRVCLRSAHTWRGRHIALGHRLAGLMGPSAPCHRHQSASRVALRIIFNFHGTFWRLGRLCIGRCYTGRRTIYLQDDSRGNTVIRPCCRRVRRRVVL
jgi:hypothetical protein